MIKLMYLKEKKMECIKEKIRNIKDFPKKGIIFRDITTAIKDADTMKNIVDFFANELKEENIDYIVGVESRGFIIGMPVAYKLGCGFIPVRKPNKLPAETLSVSYDLEYGSDSVEIHKDAIEKGKRVVLMDDLLATGGTAAASAELIKKTGGELVACGFLIELCDLNGREKLPKDSKIITMVKY